MNKRSITKPELNIKKLLANPLKFNKTFLFPIIILVVVVVIYFARGLLVVAIVNGRPITRIALVRELEKQSAAKTLDSLITKTLVLQEIARGKVVVSQGEVDQELEKIEQSLSTQGQKLDEVLASQGLTRKELSEQIKLQKQIEKIISKDISVSGEEVSKFISENKDSFPKDSTQEQINQMAKEQLNQQKLNEKLQVWLDELHAKAKIIRLVKF